MTDAADAPTTESWFTRHPKAWKTLACVIPALLLALIPDPAGVEPGGMIMLGIFVVFFVVLGYLGIQPVSEIGTLLAQIGTIFYFGFFVLMPWWSQIGEFKAAQTA